MMSASGFLNDGSSDPPKLRVFLNEDNLAGLSGDSLWPQLTGTAAWQRLSEDGFEGVQLTSDATPVDRISLSFCGLDRINRPAEAAPIAAKHAERGDLCITAHVGWGLEDDDEVDRLVESVLEASQQYRLPIFIETHRATITQDLWRTVKIVTRFPEVRFNGDFSHYYCGQELVYGDWQSKLAFMEPIFQRVGFLHGRIASPGSMQVPIGRHLDARPLQAYGAINYLDHFKELWNRAMWGFLSSARAGDILIFAPELLSGTHYYARLLPDSSGKLVEESDRYAQALLCKDLARRIFAECLQSDGRSPSEMAQGECA